MRAKLKVLELQLGHSFTRSELLIQALTHRSYAAQNYERLEFLGDTVLNLAISNILFERFPNVTEGDLSRARASLVRQEALHQIATHLNVSEHMLLGDGEAKSGGYTRPSMMADTVEALLGAIFLDADYPAAEAAVLRLYQPLLQDFNPGKEQKDSKSALQEMLQGAKLALPEYTLLSKQGAAHSQTFEIGCKVLAWSLEASAVGASRKIAEQLAAAEILALYAAQQAGKLSRTKKPRQMKLNVATMQHP